MIESSHLLYHSSLKINPQDFRTTIGCAVVTFVFPDFSVAHFQVVSDFLVIYVIDMWAGNAAVRREDCRPPASKCSISNRLYKTVVVRCARTRILFRLKIPVIR